jgi:hypothetical protein
VFFYTHFYNQIDGDQNARKKFQFFENCPEPRRTKLVRAWRTVVLGAYFIGIMKSFQNNVKIFGAIRASGHMN